MNYNIGNNSNNYINWVIKKNCNAIYSKLQNITDFYLGKYDTLEEFIDVINKRNDIIAFVWHTQELEVPEWRGKGYILTENDLKKLNITNNNEWCDEDNVISGIKIMNSSSINIRKMLCENRLCKKLTIQNLLHSLYVISKMSFTTLVLLTSYTTISTEISKYNITRID